MSEKEKTMRRRFVSADRKTPQMFPPTIEEYLPEDHLARFVVEIVEQLDLRRLTEAYSGRGSAAYHPGMKVALLFYGYATGTFSSRKLEKATYDSVAYRYICANSNPDHDSINRFRKRFGKELGVLFVQILQIAGQIGMGTVSVDGTKIKANASRHKALSWKRARKIEKQLNKEVKELMRLAREADNSKLPEDMNVPEELQRREAKREIQERAKHRYERESEVYGEKVEKREQYEKQSGKKAGGSRPRDKDQVNLVDGDSRIMPSGGGFEQAYNAQGAVDVESRLIVTRHVTQNTNDKREMEPVLEQLKENEQRLGKAENLLADSGYYSASNVNLCDRAGIKPYISKRREKHNRPFWERFAQCNEEEKEPATPVEDMQRRLGTSAGKKMYSKRKSTIEPVFGIMKQVMGFRQFMVRGLEAVRGEWNLVCIGYNLKRMYALKG